MEELELSDPDRSSTPLAAKVSAEAEETSEVSERCLLNEIWSLAGEGTTGLIVDRGRGAGVGPGVRSSCTGVNFVSLLSYSSSMGEDGGEVAVEKRLDEGEKGALLEVKEVSGSEVVVEVDARFDLRG